MRNSTSWCLARASMATVGSAVSMVSVGTLFASMYSILLSTQELANHPPAGAPVGVQPMALLIVAILSSWVERFSEKTWLRYSKLLSTPAGAHSLVPCGRLGKVGLAAAL